MNPPQDNDTLLCLKEIEQSNVVEIWVVVSRGAYEANGGDCEADGGDCDGQSDSRDESEYDGGQCTDSETNEGLLDDIQFDTNVDPSAEFAGVEDSVRNVDGVNMRNLINQEINFSDDNSAKDSEDEEEVVKFKLPQFRAKTEMHSPKFSIGLTFASKAEFKDVVDNYAFANGKKIEFPKNDNVRCVALCKQPNCPWAITLRKEQQALSWKITVINLKHDGCCWARKNCMVNSTKIAKRWKNEIAGNTKWKTREFLTKVSTQEGFGLSMRQAYRALKKARAAIKGEEHEIFKKLWSYCDEIERTNPGSTYKVKLSDLVWEGDEGRKRFMKFYMCWDACKKGYKFCRPIIGVDGCHLKGIYGGQLLLAIGIDGDDSIFPLAYAIVENENKDSWKWFLNYLKSDLQITEADENKLTFISDKQKSLLHAFDEVFPKATHRFCVRHLHGNMKLAGVRMMLPPSKGKKTLGLKSVMKQPAKKYVTRGNSTLKSKFHSNHDDPIDIDSDVF